MTADQPASHEEISDYGLRIEPWGLLRGLVLLLSSLLSVTILYYGILAFPRG